MEKIKNIWRKFLHWYFFISLIIGFVMTAVIYSLASDNNVLTIRNHNLVLENQNLKSKLWQKNIDSPDDKQNLEKKPTMTPTAKPKETSNDSVESGGNLAPYSEVKVGTNNKTSKEILIKLYGGNNDKYLGDLRLNYYLQPVMDGVKILGIEQFSGCLPGAPRGHRGGKHQGLDHYTKDCGTLCVYGTPVKAIYPGVIIRIDHDYQEMTYKEINDVYNIMTNIGKSGVDIDTDHQYQVLFDKVRGRQVEIDHGNGLISAYCHLSDVNKSLDVGDTVNAGDVIGNMGNSGTRKAAEDFDNGYVMCLDLIDNPSQYFLSFIEREWHLHLELWFSPEGADDPAIKTKWLDWISWKEVFGYK